MKTSLRRFLAIAAAAVLLSACSAEGHTIRYHADYPVYQTADELYQRATLVVEAHLGDTARVVQDRPRPVPPGADPRSDPRAGAPQGAAEPPQEPIVTTVHQARVVKVFKGTAKPGDVIEVKELGGTVDGVTYEEAEGRPLERNRKYVLFLETYPDSPASLLSPEQGKYPVDAAGEPAPLTGNPIRLTRPDLERLATGG
ncbi:hypothetical protein ABZ907_28905 [Nonomuraea wenchangensis]